MVSSRIEWRHPTLRGLNRPRPPINRWAGNYDRQNREAVTCPSDLGFRPAVYLLPAVATDHLSWTLNFVVLSILKGSSFIFFTNILKSLTTSAFFLNADISG